LVHAAPASAEPQTAPSGLWSIRFIDAQLPEAKGIGLPWDGDGTSPDPYVRLTLDGRVVWESPVQKDTLHPEWNVTLPRNILVTAQTKFRLELWDSDTASSDPAGSITRYGLPEAALPDAFAHLSLDNLATVTVVVSRPQPAQGMGVEFEQHPDALWVLTVEKLSPAARAGIQVGDRVVAIGDTRVATMTAARAASELSLSADRGATLTITNERGNEREITLDRDYLWLTM
jgi:membrane-associated protease RseP (regulator of RpoE activity)